jgi:hypothetical protein
MRTCCSTVNGTNCIGENPLEETIFVVKPTWAPMEVF